MGCGNTKPSEQSQTNSTPIQKAPAKQGQQGNKQGQYQQKPTTKPAPTGKPSAQVTRSPEPKAGGADEKAANPDFLKHIGELNNMFTAITVGNKLYYLCCIPKKEGKEIGLEFGGVVGSDSQYIAFNAVFSENELNTKRDVVQISTWVLFFKSIRSAFTSKKISCKDSSTATLSINVPVDGSKKELSFMLKAQPNPYQTAVHRLFLEPLIQYASKRLTKQDDERFQKVEVDTNGIRGNCSAHQQRLTNLETDVANIREKANIAQDDARAAKEQLEGVERRIAKLSNPSKADGNQLYADAPVRYLLHTMHSASHVPKPLEPNRTALHYIKQKFGAATGDAPVATGLAHEEVLKVLEKIDDWDFDVFALDKHTNGGALFMTTYTLLYQYELVQHFNIPESTLINFLTAVQSGYHPNPYHNATHAADVLQITHYILGTGGMGEQIQITKEDQLAALLASAIHDYDHPGFNNNFHCRTNAYLATLYNDRSVLENHHLAQVFELMKNPKFDLLGTLGYESRKEVRETMIEMVLSTDMGNHAKIFQQFRKRLLEEQEWLKREDQRLALSIAIKMADISNCGRPHELYMEWATRIADEFYAQGDVEAKLKFTISPFMDRKKYKTDFPKGQISFMNYIVIPLFEAGANFLPKMEFTVKKIQENKEHWKDKEEGGH